MATLTYVQQSEIYDVVSEDELIALTTDEKGAAEPDTSRIDNALAWAEDQVNAYLVKRYDVPLTNGDGSAPTVVRGAVLSFARYRLYNRRSRATPDGVYEDRQAQLRFLEAVAAGRADIPIKEASGRATMGSRASAGYRDSSRPDFSGLW